MPDSFRQAYAGLRNYIAQNPQIEMTDSVIGIPEEVRAGFYRVFNAAREAFVEEKFPVLLDRARLLQDNYVKAEGELAGLVSWEDAPTVSPVQRFLRSSRQSLARELFDSMFDLLKGRESLETFEQKGLQRIAAVWPPLFRGGYEKWAVLSLVKLLAPRGFLRVNVRPLNPGERGKSAVRVPSIEIPAPERSANLLFSQPYNAILAVPDLIVQSGALSRFVGIRSEFRPGLYNASNASLEREWSPIHADLLMSLESGLTLIYLAEKPESISLVADATRFCRPDLVLGCIDTRIVPKDAAMEAIAAADSRINPVVGSYVVACEPWPESGVNVETGPASRIRFIKAGYDELQLLPVIDALVEPAGTT